jgi:hypothetical protein
MLRRVRFYGPRGGPQGEGDQEGHPQRNRRLHHSRTGCPHRGCLPRNHSYGKIVKDMFRFVKQTCHLCTFSLKMLKQS